MHALRQSDHTMDVVLIDGRFRIACAAAAYEHLSTKHAVLVHDFQRVRYRPLLRIYDVVNMSGTLAHLRRKSPPETAEAARMVQAYVTDPLR